MQTVALCFSPIIAICCSVFKLFGTLSSNQVIGVVLGWWGDHIGQVSPSGWGGQGLQSVQCGQGVHLDEYEPHASCSTQSGC